MKEDPREYWDNVPHELDTPPPANVPDVPHRKTMAEREEMEFDAMEYNDKED